MSYSARESFVFAIEDEYAVTPKAREGDSQLKWFIPPPGSWFNTSYSRSVSSIYEVGRKRLTDFNYGKVSGTWQWRFVLDYNYLEPLLLAFEDYRFENLVERTSQGTLEPWERWGVHRFHKREDATVRSFTVRMKRLNRVAGGVSDEVVEYNGCVCTTISFSQASTTSEVRVTMDGIYSTESMDSDALLEGLDLYESKSPKLVEFGCAYAGDTMFTNVQDWAIRIGNNLKGIYGVGYPCVRSYYENESAYSFSMTLFANNPKQLAQRVYSGGYTNTCTTPIKEGALPIPEIQLRSRSDVIEVYNVQSTDPNSPSTQELRYSLDIAITNCTVQAMSWMSSEGEKILDKLNNGACEYMEFTFINQFPVSYLSDSFSDFAWESHVIPSPSD